LTLREVGERVGLTREMVSKLEARALRKLGHSTPAAASSSARKFA
jgi:DNA-directed RNA polymerase sigma subunit (sigma70/sigma32)